MDNQNAADPKQDLNQNTAPTAGTQTGAAQPSAQMPPPPPPPIEPPPPIVQPSSSIVTPAGQQMNAAGDEYSKSQPGVSVGPRLKEQQPVEAGRSLDSARDFAEADKVAKKEGDEYWESYAREIELEKQILEMGGVEKVESGEVKVPADVAKEMGIAPVVEVHTPMAQATGFSVGGTSLDDSQLSAGVKKPTSSGLKWLVEWFIYQLLKAHYHVKRIKGKIVREAPSSSPASTKTN